MYREDEGGVEDGGEGQHVREAVERLGEGEGDGGAREQQARGDELRLGGAAAVEGEGVGMRRCLPLTVALTLALTLTPQASPNPSPDPSPSRSPKPDLPSRESAESE